MYGRKEINNTDWHYWALRINVTTDIFKGQEKIPSWISSGWYRCQNKAEAGFVGLFSGFGWGFFQLKTTHDSLLSHTHPPSQ